MGSRRLRFSSPTSLRHLHDDLVIREVFGKLPLSTQWASRSVSKHWRAMLTGATDWVRQDYIVVNAIDHLIFYNVHERRWVRPLPLSSLSISSLELDRTSLCAVCGEHFLFRDSTKPPRLAIWNALTNESRVLDEVGEVPGDEDAGFLEFGLFVRETGEIKLLLYNYFDFDDGDMFVWEQDNKDGEWEQFDKPGEVHGPNFNSRNGLVTFLDNGPVWVHVYDVEKKSFKKLAWYERQPDEVPEPVVNRPVRTIAEYLETAVFEPTEMFDWDNYGLGGRFLLEGRGVYLIGTLKIHIERDNAAEMGVLWFNQTTKKIELLSESPPGLIAGIRSEAEDQYLCYCSDGVENLYVVAPGSSSMVRYNVESREWVSIPTILAMEGFNYMLEMSCGALYTTL